MDPSQPHVLFISYNGMLDPLGQTQVLPYLRALAEKGIHFTLLSFERAYAFTGEGRSRCDELRTDLAAVNIQWHALRYHQRPSVPATIYDVLQGVRLAHRLIKQNDIQLVHARSHIPATMALLLKKLTGVKMIFDVRGLMAEEYIEANHWQKGNIPYRLTKQMERSAFAASDGVVTLTERVWPVIQQWKGLQGREVAHEVVPCCADLDKFSFSSEDRERRRAELKLTDRTTIVYSGSIGPWYLTAEMADFFRQILRTRKDAHFLWLTPGNPQLIETVMNERGIPRSSYTVKTVMPADVASYLSAADVGIAFYKPGLSKLATSPVKITEYLACGLPVVLNSGIGDSDLFLKQSGVGTIVPNFTEADYVNAWNALEPLIANADETRRHARDFARGKFDLHNVGADRYFRLYEKILPMKAQYDFAVRSGERRSIS